MDPESHWPLAKIAGYANGTVAAAAGFKSDDLVSPSFSGPAPSTNAGCYVRIRSQRVLNALEQILRKIPNGLYELVCHPGEDDADTRRRYSHWDYHWAEELKALTAPETRAILNELGIALTSFAQASSNRGDWNSENCVVDHKPVN